MLAQQLVNGLSLGAVYALVALGYTLVYGILGLINFAHAEVLMCGAFLAAAAAPAGGFPGALAACMLGGGLLNAGIERVAYRPLRGRGALAPLISALGVSLMLQNGVFLLVSTQSLPFPEMLPARSFKLGSAWVSSVQLMAMLTAAALTAALSLFIGRTRLGRAMRACAQDPEAAALMGIDRDRTVGAAFFLGGALAGAAGLLYGLSYGSIRYNLGFLPGVKAFTAAVLGGIGSLPGAVLGGLLLGVLEVLAAGYFPAGAEWKDALVFSVLIGLLLYRPTGFLGESLAEKL